MKFEYSLCKVLRKLQSSAYDVFLTVDNKFILFGKCSYLYEKHRHNSYAVFLLEFHRFYCLLGHTKMHHKNTFIAVIFLLVFNDSLCCTISQTDRYLYK